MATVLEPKKVVASFLDQIYVLDEDGKRFTKTFIGFKISNDVVSSPPPTFEPAAVLCCTESVEDLVGGSDAVTNWVSGSALGQAPTWQERRTRSFVQAVKDLIAVEKNKAKAETKKNADQLRSSTQKAHAHAAVEKKEKAKAGATADGVVEITRPAANVLSASPLVRSAPSTSQAPAPPRLFSDTCPVRRLYRGTARTPRRHFRAVAVAGPAPCLLPGQMATYSAAAAQPQMNNAPVAAVAAVSELAAVSAAAAACPGVRPPLQSSRSRPASPRRPPP
eukprot:gene2262-70_t